MNLFRIFQANTEQSLIVDDMDDFDTDYAIRTGMVDDPESEELEVVIDTNDFDFTIQTTAITPQTRTLNGEWSIEEPEELTTIHGYDSIATGDNSYATGVESEINNNYIEAFHEDTYRIYQEVLNIVTRYQNISSLNNFFEDFMNNYIRLGLIDSWSINSFQMPDCFDRTYRLHLRKSELSICFDIIDESYIRF